MARAAGSAAARGQWPRGRLALLAAAALGVVNAQCFAPTARPLLQCIAVALLFLLVDGAATPRAAALRGWAFGAGWFGNGVSWLYISMHVYGPMPGWMAATATAALAAFLALFPALAAGAAWRCATGPARRLLALPAAWALSEWLRGVLLTGFPWLAGGYAHVDGALAGYAPLLGVYGVTLAAALVSGAAAAACAARRAPRALIVLGAGAALLLAAGAGLRRVAWSEPSGAPLTVRLVQGNIPQDDKFGTSGLQRAVDAYGRLMQGSSHADLVALPESAFPIPIGDLPDGLQRALADFAIDNHSALVFGIFIEEPRDHYYNSALGFSPERDQPVQRYSKLHLVPFGEFIPYGFHWFVDLMRIPIGDQERGAAYQPPMHLAGQRVAVNICYEDLFGAEIIAAWRNPADAPTLLLNLSNLAWFADSRALPQHLQIARMRALETARPMLRATNTGVTAIIDPRGAVVAQLAPLTAGSLEREVRGYAGTTPYVRVGNGAFLALAAALLAGAAGLRRRRPRQPH